MPLTPSQLTTIRQTCGEWVDRVCRCCGQGFLVKRSENYPHHTCPDCWSPEEFSSLPPVTPVKEQNNYQHNAQCVGQGDNLPSVSVPKELRMNDEKLGNEAQEGTTHLAGQSPVADGITLTTEQGAESVAPAPCNDGEASENLASSGVESGHAGMLRMKPPTTGATCLNVGSRSSARPAGDSALPHDRPPGSGITQSRPINCESREGNRGKSVAEISMDGKTTGQSERTQVDPLIKKRLASRSGYRKNGGWFRMMREGK